MSFGMEYEKPEWFEGVFNGKLVNVEKYRGGIIFVIHRTDGRMVDIEIKGNISVECLGCD